jgi:hypothetical protein
MSDSGAGPKWIKLNPAQAVKAHDSVRDTFSKIGVPTEEQAKAYIAMLTSTASLKGDVPAGSIFDFSLAAEAARELAQNRLRQVDSEKPSSTEHQPG